MAKITLIPTPIGNLEDLTFRALRYLKEVDLLAAEDTRTSSKLLNHYGVKTPMTSLHQHNEHKKVTILLDKIVDENLHLGIVSDAGTPGISDPGFLVVREAVARGIEIETLPGATAFVPALVNSGLPCDKFCFEGFLPPKKGRQTRLITLSEEPRTIIFYESPYRLLKTLKDFVNYFGESHQVSISRELTKIHEETIRGTLTEVISYYENATIKGEMVIILAGKA